MEEKNNACWIVLGGLKQASLIDRHLVTFFVPFLPLEREHIRDCIRQELQRILDNDIYEYKLSEKQIIDDVLNLIDFSDTSLEYSISGCKIVSHKLDFTFERMRPKLKKTRKEFSDILWCSCFCYFLLNKIVPKVLSVDCNHYFQFQMQWVANSNRSIHWTVKYVQMNCFTCYAILDF